MTVAAGLALALAACAAALSARPGLVAQPAFARAPALLAALTLALAIAVGPEGGVAAQALTIAAGLLGAQAWLATWPRAAALAAPVVPGTWLALPWLLAAALQPASMPIWSEPGPAVAALALIAAAAAIAVSLPVLLAARWRWRLLLAVALAFAPVLGPLELRDAWVELPLADGAHATLRAAGRPDISGWPAWIGLAWLAPRWLAVVAIAAVLSARPRLGRSLWALAGLVALAAGIGAASAASAAASAGTLAIVGPDAPLRVVGEAAVGLGPGMARVGLVLLLVPLLDPQVRGGAGAATLPQHAEIGRASVLAAALAALAWLALALWASGAIGPTWPLDPASAALAVTALAGALRLSRPRADLAIVLALVQLAAALLLIGGGTGWRVASAWLP